jgi:hypothetical protein
MMGFFNIRKCTLPAVCRTVSMFISSVCRIFSEDTTVTSLCMYMSIYFIILAFDCRARCTVRTINYSLAAGVGAPQAVNEFKVTLN